MESYWQSKIEQAHNLIKNKKKKHKRPCAYISSRVHATTVVLFGTRVENAQINMTPSTSRTEILSGIPLKNIERRRAKNTKSWTVVNATRKSKNNFQKKKHDG